MRSTLNTKMLLGLTLSSLLILGFGCGATNTTTVKTGTQTRDNGDMPDYQPGKDDGVKVDVNADVNAGAMMAPHEVHITAKQFSFEPAEVRVKKGEKVKLIAKSVDTTHGIAIPAFNVNLTLEAGTEMTAEFTADKTGSFPFFCSVFCGSGHGAMKGTLIVE